MALTIAGSDSGGGAGIQADLKTFASLGVHGTCAITCLTAQNPKEVTSIQACTPKTLEAQIDAVFAELSPAAVKTGMLYSPVLARVVVDCLSRHASVPVVVDPVMIATSGSALVRATAPARFWDSLLPRATLVTPNLDEAAVLLDGARLGSVEAMRSAARRIHARFGSPVLVKGGHLRGLAEAIDVFYDGRDELLLQAPYIKGLSTHGTGCTYSAAITAFLARGHALARSVRLAKEYITQALAHSYGIQRHSALNSFWKQA